MGEDRSVAGPDQQRLRHSSCSEDTDLSSCPGGPDLSPDEELEYGPGIVHKLRTKFLSISLKQRSCSNMRRSCSMENILDQDGPEPCKFEPKAPLDHNLKRAKSMDTLLLDMQQQLQNGCKAQEESKRLVIKRRDGGLTRSLLTICDEELPKPDIVKTYKRMFEPAEPRRGSYSRRPPVLRASAKSSVAKSSCSAKVNGKLFSAKPVVNRNFRATNGDVNGIVPNGDIKLNGEIKTFKAMNGNLKITNGDSKPLKNDSNIPKSSFKLQNGDLISPPNGEYPNKFDSKLLVNGESKSPKTDFNAINGEMNGKSTKQQPTTNGFQNATTNGFQNVKATPARIVEISHALKNGQDSGKQHTMAPINRFVPKKEVQFSSPKTTESICNGNAPKSETRNNTVSAKTKPKVPPNRPRLIRSPSPKFLEQKMLLKPTVNGMKLNGDLNKNHLESKLRKDVSRKLDEIKLFPVNRTNGIKSPTSEIKLDDEIALPSVNKIKEEILLSAEKDKSQSPIGKIQNKLPPGMKLKDRIIESPTGIKFRDKIQADKMSNATPESLINSKIHSLDAKNSTKSEIKPESQSKLDGDATLLAADERILSPVDFHSQAKIPENKVHKLSQNSPVADITPDVRPPSKLNYEVSLKDELDNPSSPKDNNKSVSPAKNFQDDSSSSPKDCNKMTNSETKPKKASTKGDQGSSMVFDFRGKDVVAHVALLPAPFGCKSLHPKKRPEGAAPEDDDEDSVDYSYPAPCGLVFEGENIKIGRGSILSTRNKELKITFDEDVDNSTFVYPSESSLLEDGSSPLADDEIPATTRLKANTAIGSSAAGLSSYTPSVLNGFEPGMFRQPEVAKSPVVDSTPSAFEPDPEEMPEGAEMLKPAGPELTSSWSISAGTSDLLF